MAAASWPLSDVASGCVCAVLWCEALAGPMIWRRYQLVKMGEKKKQRESGLV